VENFLQYLFTGLAQGGIYALVALGFVLIYNVTGIINFAQGEFVMLGALLAVTFHNSGLSLPVVILLTVLTVAAIGGLLEFVTIRPARGAGVMTLIIITIGLSMAVRGVALLIWGTESLVIPPYSGTKTISIAGATLMPQDLWVFGTTGVVVAALYVFLEKTVMGKAFRACVINRLGASLMGISPKRMSTLAFGLGAGIGALGGVAFAPTLAIYDMGLGLGIKGFTAAALGGLTSAPGAVVAGFVLGVLESFGTAYVSSGYKDGISLAILLVMLLLRPQGLFGIYGSKRV